MKTKKELLDTKARLEDVSPSFCLAKWKNSTIHLYNGHTQSCHHVRGQKFDLGDPDPTSMHNSPDKLRARKKMQLGKKPKECEYCWNVERNGGLSDRVHKSSEQVYADFFDEVVFDKTFGKTISPSFLELAFDNSCQFKCMYCSPAYSSQWEKEVLEFGDYPTVGNLINSKYNKSRLPLPEDQRKLILERFWRWWPQLRRDLRYLRITGGEPLVSSETYKLVDEIIKNPCPELSFAINSNLGFSETYLQKFAEKLSRLQHSVKSTLLFTSIDSTGKQAEYIRYGLNTSVFWRNIRFVLSQPIQPLTLCFMITVNALSLPGLRPLLKKIQSLKEEYPQHKIQIDTPYLRQPEHLSVEILTPDFKVYVEKATKWMKSSSTYSESEMQKVERILPLVANPGINKAKLFLLRQDFNRYFKEYDRRKGTSLESTFPEYKDFISLCESKMKNLNSSFLVKNI